MINLTKSKDDLIILTEAYYNMLGHFTVFSNNNIDKLIKKSI